MSSTWYWIKCISVLKKNGHRPSPRSILENWNALSVLCQLSNRKLVLVFVRVNLWTVQKQTLEFVVSRRDRVQDARCCDHGSLVHCSHILCKNIDTFFSSHELSEFGWFCFWWNVKRGTKARKRIVVLQECQFFVNQVDVRWAKRCVCIPSLNSF